MPPRAVFLSSILLAAVFLATGGESKGNAQAFPDRLSQPINPNSLVALRGTVNPRAEARFSRGRLDPATPLEGITIYFRPTASQKAELDALVRAQQTPGSPEYHQWLTPAQYASRFGLSTADVSRIENWIESQGFNIERVANSRTSITFSGTAEQVENAFQTEMHRYVVDGRTHFANATNLSIPSALAGLVRSVRNLNDFRPRPEVRFHPQSSVQPIPAFTSASTGTHYLTPKDIATIYDITPAYSAGYTGVGQSIAVVGQSEIKTSDIEAFQNAAGLAVNDPRMVLVPNSGTAAFSPGDEAESDLDVEYAGATGREATIYLVYVGNSQNYSVFDALTYAVDNRLSPVISISYGSCETELSSSEYSSLEAVLEQGASQGQSIIAAGGDEGSTSCFYPQGNSGLSTAQQETPAVNYPASSAFATGIGGTEFPAQDVSPSNNTYWESASGSDVVSSATSYIPEQVWNDDNPAFAAQFGADAVLSSGGGGVSTLTTRPSWQSGVPGIPSGGYRLVPDISLDSSAINAGYLYCTSDTSAWSSGQKASCDSGFRDLVTHDLTVAGGTSFATPMFAGMVAIMNQKTNSPGQGVVGPTLYSLASSASVYGSAFHDITSGGNQCTAGSSYCSAAGASEYAAGPGYDEASGLGSVDFNNLMQAWPTGSSSLALGATSAGAFTLAATNVTAAAGASGQSTVTAVSQNSFAGTLSFAVTSTNASVNSSGCFVMDNGAVAAGGTYTGKLTIYTSQSACAGAPGSHSFLRTVAAGTVSPSHPPPPGGGIPAAALALGGVLLLGLRHRGGRNAAFASSVIFLLIAGLAAGCGGRSTPASPSSASGGSPSAGTTTTTAIPAGTYTLTLTGTDTNHTSLTASATFTLTVQ